jgi:hypothetical protein
MGGADVRIGVLERFSVKCPGCFRMDVRPASRVASRFEVDCLCELRPANASRKEIADDNLRTRMRRRLSRHVGAGMSRHATPLIAALLFVSMILTASADERYADAVGDWAHEHYAAVLDELMPVGPTVPDARTMTALAVIRVVPSGLVAEEQEVQFTIEQRGDQHTMLTIVRPVGASVLSQIRQLKLEHADWGCAEVTAAVRMERSTTTVGRGSALSPLIRKVVAANLGIVPNIPMFVDPTIYSIHSWTPAAELKIEIRGPGARARRQPTSLLKAIEQLRQNSAVKAAQ